MLMCVCVCVYCIAHVFRGTFVIFVTLMHGAMMQMPMSFMLTCIKTNIRVTDMELCAFSGVTSTGFVAVGLGVITSSNGWVSTCPESGNTIIPHHHFGTSIAWNN